MGQDIAGITARLRARRAELGLTVNALTEQLRAAGTPVSNRELYRILANKRVLRQGLASARCVRSLRSIARVMGLDPDAFFDPLPRSASFGARVRDARLHRGWSQARLARESGLNTRYISETERDAWAAPEHVVRALIDTLHL